MKIRTYYFIAVSIGIFVLIASGCNRKKMVCAAYQSYYIMDKDKADLRFTGFKINEMEGGESGLVPPDSTKATKDKFGVQKSVNTKTKEKKLKVVKMENVFLPAQDGPRQDTIFLDDEYGGADEEIYASTAATVSSGRRTQPISTVYNRDQLMYHRLLGKYLPKPSPKKEETKKVDQIMPEEDTDTFQETDVFGEGPQSEPEKKQKKGKRKKGEQIPEEPEKSLYEDNNRNPFD